MSTADILVGTPCPRSNCDGTLKCVKSVPTSDGKYMQRYYGCNKCGCRPEDNKRIIPMQYSGRRTATNSP